mmetsp:Transcript_18158/g.36562  ORF Transcript_18158/g.36562 Transcript_18158/m.36562 type:complete len:212 (-) Transcript_18158:206-841(-)
MTTMAVGSAAGAAPGAAPGAATSTGTSTSSSPPTVAATAAAARSHEELISHARTYYTHLGYRVHSGLQFGCELVLYSDNPEYVHSDFCVVVLPQDGRVDWRRIQSLTRQMSDWKKTLILAEVTVGSPVVDCTDGNTGTSAASSDNSDGAVQQQEEEKPEDETTSPLMNAANVKVTELAISTEHAPFRHRRVQTVAKAGTVDVGSQRKKQKS